MTSEPAQPISKGMNVLRWSFGSLLASLLLFSILMATWGDLREALMLKVLDDRYVKSFTIQIPEAAKVWVGDKYLGDAKIHPLGVDEPADYPQKVEGMPVVLPRVYVYEEPLLEVSIDCNASANVRELLEQLAPGETVLWAEREMLTEAGFTPVLLKLEDGRYDFLNLVRVDWPRHDGGTTRRVFVMRVWHEGRRVFTLARTEYWTDQLYAKDGGFWASREQWDDFPPLLSGQTKTVWRWYVTPGTDDAAWLNEHVPGDYSNVDWLRLDEKE